MTKDQFREFLDSIGASTHPSAQLPYIAVDECVDSPVLETAILRLFERNLAEGSGPLWNTRYERSDGTIFYAMGGLSRARRSNEFSNSRPVAKAKWDDAKVVTTLLHHFHSRDRLVLLTADFRLNEGGLRSLLQAIAEPVLEARHRQRFSLTVLFKTGGMDFEEYAKRIIQVFQQGPFGYGYAEKRL